MPDPLDDIYELTPEQQMLVVISVLRSTRNSISDLRNEVQWVKRGLWTLITTLIVGIVVFIITSSISQRTNNPHTAKPFAKEAQAH